MDEPGKVDFSKLLGFGHLGEVRSGEVDFSDETFSARLGAKVGVEVTAPPAPAGRSEVAAE
jgi:hypothetical protein